MPARLKRNKRRRSVHVTPEAVALFKQGFDMQRGPHDPYELRGIKIRLAAALGRSKFRACPLDREPRSLIGGDTEPVEVALGLRVEMLKRISKKRAVSANFSTNDPRFVALYKARPVGAGTGG
jgi:hypothetical protein